MTLSPGARLGPYEILSALGAGGMGEVYRGRDTRLGREVAIKIVLDEVSPSARARFEDEVRAAASLSHPNICAVYDVGDADGRLYFVMELVDGATLGQYARGRALDIREVRAIGMQVAEALEAAHAQGIIHRDIKPGNILMTPRGHVKVADFGLAKRVATAEARTIEPLTSAGATMGTLQYMSPEMLQGKPADPRSDIWALGAVLYELLTGHAPFHQGTAYEISAAILSGTPPSLPPSVRSDTRAIVERCMAHAPGDRYEHASDVGKALEHLETDSVGHVNSRRTWGFLAAAAAVVIVAVAILTLRSDRAEDPARRTSTGAPASSNQEANEAFELAMNTQRVQGDIRRGQQLLERAIALDPHFAEALRYHAINHALSILNGLTVDTSVLYTAENELRRASAEYPSLVSLPSAFTAVYLMQGRRELVPIDALDRVISEYPSHRDSVFWRAILYWLDGNHRAVKQLTTGILTREPLWSPPRMFLGDTLRMEGDVSGALRELQKIFEQAPGTIPAVRLLVLAHLDAGDIKSAHLTLESTRSAFENNYVWRLTRALVLAAEGRRSEAVDALDQETLKYAAAAFVATLDAAEIYSLVGDASKAIEWVERAVRNGDERLAWFRVNPRLSAIRQDPRFLRILQSIESRRSIERR